MAKTTKAKVAMAVHLKDKKGDNHLVAITALKVLLLEDGGSWFAQGLDLDYAAAGKNVQEAKQNFEAGLAATIVEYVKMYGSIEKMLKPAPKEAWDEFYAAPKGCIKTQYSTIQALSKLKFVAAKNEPQGAFPFSGIAFLEPQSLAA